MPDFSSTYLPQFVEFIRPHILSEEICYLPDLCNFNYYLLHRDVLKYVAEHHGKLNFMIGRPEPNIFYISENVREEYRNYFLYHEYYEFDLLPANSTNKCPTAMKRELEIIPENIKANYIKFRYEFFVNLHQFLTYLESSTAEFLNEMQDSINILQEEVKKNEYGNFNKVME